MNQHSIAMIYPSSKIINSMVYQFLMTLTAALAFAHLSHAQTTNSGAINFANASARQKFAQQTCTSEQISTT